MDGCTPSRCPRPATSTPCLVSPPGWRCWCRSRGRRWSWCVAGLFAQALPVPILLSARSAQLGFAAHPYVLSRSLCSASQCQRDSPGSHQHPVAPGSDGGAGGICVLVRKHGADACSMLLFSWSPPSLDRTVSCLRRWSCSSGGLRRQPWSLVVFALVGVVACAQIAVLTHSTHRVQGALGATPEGFLRMLGGHVVACALMGSYSFASLAPMTFIVPAALGWSLHLLLLPPLCQPRVEVVPPLLRGCLRCLLCTAR